MRAIGYARVSTDKQADHGVSLEAQEAKIRGMATVQGAEIVDLIVDGGESAKNLKRPGTLFSGCCRKGCRTAYSRRRLSRWDCPTPDTRWWSMAVRHRAYRSLRRPTAQRDVRP